MRKFTKLFSAAAALTLLISNLSAPAFAQTSIPSQLSNSPSGGGSATLGQSIFPNLGSLSTQFVRPAAAAFTLINPSSAILVDNVTPAALTLQPAARTASTNLITAGLPAAATPYTIIALIQRIGPMVPLTGSGIILTDGTKSVMFGPRNASTSATQTLTVSRYTNATTITTAAISWGFQSAPLIWLRVINDGTNISYAISYDRIDWLTVLTEAKGAFLSTITNYGFGIDTNDSGASNQTSWTQLWYWLVS